MPFPARAALLLLAPLSSLPILAQQPLVLDVVVTAVAGRDRTPVSGLAASDFVLLDNGLPQAVSSFRASSGLQSKTQFVILLDAVNVPFGVLADERQQVAGFLRADAGRLTLPTSLGVVTDLGLRPLTSEGHGASSRDGNALALALDHDQIALRTIRRSAGFYGAQDRLNLSLNALRSLALQERGRPGRKIVLWVSPGWPALSGPGVQLSARQQQRTFADIRYLSDLLREARITLYGIDPLGAEESLEHASYYQAFLKPAEKPSQVDLGDLSLQVLAVQSGGLALRGSNDIAALLRQAVADTGAFYELTFSPPPAEQSIEYHHLEVRLNRPGLIARTRVGYYIPPSASGAPAEIDLQRPRP